MIDSILKEHGRLDGLVNNAGIVLSKPVEEITEAELDLCINVNFKGTLFGCQFALPGFKVAGGGAIVNISSTSGMVANLPGLSAYCATKGAVRLFTILVMVFGLTRFIRELSKLLWLPSIFADKSTEELLANAAILKRVGKPSEVSETVVFLLSDRSSYMTGSELVVDGGVTAQ